MDDEESAANWTQCVAFYIEEKSRPPSFPASLHMYMCTVSPPPRQTHRV